MALQQAFLWVSSLFPCQKSLHHCSIPAITAPCSVTHSWLGSTLRHPRSLGCGLHLCCGTWLAAASSASQPAEWKCESVRIHGNGKRKCVIKYCHVRCNQLQPCKFNSSLHALYGQKRESRHLQSWNHIHYILMLWNLSHCTGVKWFWASAVCQTDFGRLIDQSEDSIQFMFFPSYPFCFQLLKWSSHPCIVDKSSTNDKSDESSLIWDTWCGSWCDVYTHRRKNITVLKLRDRAGCSLVKEIYTFVNYYLFG